MNDIFDNLLFDALSQASDNVYIYMTDMSTGVTRWSQNAVSYFDMPGEYMTDVPSFWPKRIHPNDRDAYLTDINAVLSGLSNRHSCQYRVLNRYGEYVWIECKGSIFQDTQGRSVFAGMMTRLDSQSMYDPLTGLPSKNQFYDYDLCNESGTILLIGIDNFRRVISSYGYECGDDILVQAGKLLSYLCQDSMKVFRFNGDEFIFILPGHSMEDTGKLFNMIQKQISHLELQNGQSANLTFSGSAITYPYAEWTKDMYVNKLEVTLDYIKRENRGHIRCYCDEIETMLNRVQLLKKELRASINHDFEGFELYFQPWVGNDGAKILGCEALLRWKGETIKDSNPGEFIPILEESDDIVEVGRWVMQESMKQQKNWEDHFGNFIVSFNVSYRQFLVPNYVHELVDTANKLGVNPTHMILELTESCRVQSPAVLANVFADLRAAGFKIALDDFGTGYASLEMLKHLPTDGIKIEHNFVRELAKEGHHVDLAIIESILFLCKRLDCEVVVEGIENDKVDNMIRQMDANYLQGYFYSRPICKTEFEELLQKNIREQA